MGRRPLGSLGHAPRRVRSAHSAQGARRRHSVPHRLRGARRGDGDSRDEGGSAELHPAGEPRAALPDPRARAERGADPPGEAQRSARALGERAAVPHARGVGARRDPDRGYRRDAPLRERRRRAALRLPGRGPDRPARDVSRSRVPAAPAAHRRERRGGPPRHDRPRRERAHPAAGAVVRRAAARRQAPHDGVRPGPRREDARRTGAPRVRGPVPARGDDVERPRPRVRARDRRDVVVRRRRPHPRPRRGRLPAHDRGLAPRDPPRGSGPRPDGPGPALGQRRAVLRGIPDPAQGRRAAPLAPHRYAPHRGRRRPAQSRNGDRRQQPSRDRGGAAAVREALPDALRAEPRRRLPLDAGGPHPRLQRELRPDLRLPLEGGGPPPGGVGLLRPSGGPRGGAREAARTPEPLELRALPEAQGREHRCGSSRARA